MRGSYRGKLNWQQCTKPGTYGQLAFCMSWPSTLTFLCLWIEVACVLLFFFIIFENREAQLTNNTCRNYIYVFAYGKCHFYVHRVGGSGPKSYYNYKPHAYGRPLPERIAHNP